MYVTACIAIPPSPRLGYRKVFNSTVGSFYEVSISSYPDASVIYGEEYWVGTTDADCISIQY